MSSMERPKAVIFDMDGTLCDVSSIRHHVIPDHPDNLTGRKDFETFHASAVDCPPNADVLAAALAAHEAGVKVLIVTARREKWRASTSWWLSEAGVTPAVQLHRPDWDQRQDVDVKRDMLSRLRARFDIIEAWDDNPAIIELWRSEGIRVHEVPGWHLTARP